MFSIVTIASYQEDAIWLDVNCYCIQESRNKKLSSGTQAKNAVEEEGIDKFFNKTILVRHPS